MSWTDDIFFSTRYTFNVRKKVKHTFLKYRNQMQSQCNPQVDYIAILHGGYWSQQEGSTDEFHSLHYVPQNDNSGKITTTQSVG